MTIITAVFGFFVLILFAVIITNLARQLYTKEGRDYFFLDEKEYYKKLRAGEYDNE